MNDYAAATGDQRLLILSAGVGLSFLLIVAAVLILRGGRPDPVPAPVPAPLLPLPADPADQPTVALDTGVGSELAGRRESHRVTAPPAAEPSPASRWPSATPATVYFEFPGTIPQRPAHPPATTPVRQQPRIAPIGYDGPLIPLHHDDRMAHTLQEAAPPPPPPPSLSPEPSSPEPPSREKPVTADLVAGGIRIQVSLVGVTGEGPGAPHGWRDPARPMPAATLPVDLGDRNGRRLYLDLNRCPDALTVSAALPDGEAYTLHLIRQVIDHGYDVAILGYDIFTASIPQGCRRVATMTDACDSGSPGIVVSGRLSGRDLATARAARASGGPIPVLIGDVPRARWSVRLP
ncbi:hypothetical protein [Actinoplanes sp. NPDC051851]|uniref:hypothetical protein n=1 Tax=Actinoplanes sp. NPDC051851 TaxID=3154753 RepID=UPI0034323C05